MIDRIERIFASNRAAGKGTLMPFVTGGFPSLEVTEQVIPELERAGASIIEIGIPFSDPIADGPVIAASMHSALLKGSTPASVLAAVARARRETMPAWS